MWETWLILMTYTTQGYICGTFFTLLVNSNFIGCDSTSKLWNIKALAETHPERSECSCKVTILFQGMFFCYMLQLVVVTVFHISCGLYQDQVLEWLVSACDDCILVCEEESLIYTKSLSACVSALTLNPWKWRSWIHWIMCSWTCFPSPSENTCWLVFVLL